MKTDVIQNHLERIQAALAAGKLSSTTLEDSGAVVMLVERDQMLTVNSSAAWLLDYLQNNPSSLSALNAAFAAQFDLAAGQAEQDVATFLSTLAQHL
jgi:tripartite-type tricarboxylate transporter receptor subunit TctC